MFKEVIVVEGRDDTRRLKEVYGEIATFETGGSALNSEKLQHIKTLQNSRGVIVFTDPDYPGQKIRNMITEAIPESKHAYIDKIDARHKSGIGLGVEHASAAAIKKALESVMTPLETIENHNLSQQLLLELGLVAGPVSKKRREILSHKLGIGYVNGKQLLKRLQMFGITEEKVRLALSEEN